MALSNDELKQITDAITKGMSAVTDSFGRNVEKLTDGIDRIITQQKTGIPSSAMDYRGGRFGRSVFGEDLEKRIQRLERDRNLQYRDTDIATSGKRLFSGISKPARELEYEKNRVLDTLESYKNSVKDLKSELQDGFNLSGITDSNAIDKAKEKFKEIGDEIGDLKSEIREIKDEFDNTDFTDAFSFDKDGEVLSANIEKVRELKDKFQDIGLTEEEIEDIAKRQYKLFSDLNKKEQERADIGGKIAEVYDRQTDSLREQARYADMSIETMKRGFSEIGRGFGKLKRLGSDLIEGWRKVDQASANFAKNIGVGNKGLVALRKNTMDMVANKGIGLNYGVGMEELIEVQQNYLKTAGRNVGLTAEDIETGAAMSRVMGGKGGEFASALENFGLSYTEAGKRAGKMFADASKYGLSFEKYSDNFLKNIKLAQNYTFKDGLRGLERMAKKATEIRIDMQQMANFADKVSTLQGAVETSAQLQVLGGPFAQFSDPLGMMNEGLNDMEGLMDRFKNMTNEFGKFNAQTGQVEVSAFNKQRIKAAAQAMGMDYGQVMESVQEQGRRNFVEGQLNAGGRNFTDAQREFLMNTATVQNGKAVMSYLDATGNRVEKNVNELTAQDIEQARAQNQSDTDNIKSIAKATMSLDEKWKGVEETVKAIKAQAVEPVMNKISGILSESQKYLKWIKIAVYTIAGMKAAGAVGTMIKGGVNVAQGAGAFGRAGRLFRLGAAGRTGMLTNGGGFFGKLGGFMNKPLGRLAPNALGAGTKLGGAIGAFGSAAAIAGVVTGLIQGQQKVNESKRNIANRNKDIAMGRIKKDDSTDREITASTIKEKWQGRGEQIGSVAGAALGLLAGPVGAAFGAWAGKYVGRWAGGVLSKKKQEKEIEKRHQESIEENRLNSILKRHGFDLKGGYNKDEYNQIMSAINQNGDNTITKAEFETLPEELKKKMMENGDVTLFPDLEEYKVEEGTFDVENAVLNATNLTINGDIGKTKRANGGLLNGPSHAQGGMPIVGSNIEVEGGEYVVNKNATRSNIGLLNAINKMSSGGMISPVVDTFVKPIGVLPNVTNNNYTTGGGIMGMQPIDVNINGTIKLDGGNGKQVDMGALLKDPVFIRQITNLIEQQLTYTSHGARYTNKLKS